MTNIITQVRQALIARLQTISQVNGYRTNIGADVRAGWFNELVEEGGVADAGTVVVQRAKGKEPKGEPYALKMATGFSVIGAVKAALNGYEAALEDVELDLLRCLTPTQGVPPTWLPKGALNVAVGTPDPYPPGKGQPAATVLIPIHIITIVESIDSTDR
jgi:hypothetical protein